MRAIDADALRDRLQSLGYDDWNQGATTTWAEAFSECADMVDDAPTIEPEPHWILCRERLPEYSGRYLVSVLDGIDRRTTVAPYHPQRRTWTLTGRMAYWKVIAWMPLPEPYKERRTDE